MLLFKRASIYLISSLIVATKMIQPEDDLSDEMHCRWNKFSEKKLVNLEKKILEAVKTAYKGWFVPIGKTVGEDDKIWTLSLNEESKNTPLVLLHGFAAGVGFWCLNLDALAKNRPVYAIDLLGFGRSSRPDFQKDSLEAEHQMVNSIEEWRKKVNLDKFILLGHSFGAYLATSYSLNYPERVKHLILADPWGFTEKPPDFNPPLRFKIIAFFLYPLLYLNPLAAVRAAGPWGLWLVKKMRSDIAQKYSSQLEDSEIISEYIYQCNAQKPTGETAFHNMVKDVAWAKNPMMQRIPDLNKNIPLTLIYGGESWVDRKPGPVIKEQRSESHVQVHIIKNAGHHLHADEPESFNKLVTETCLWNDMAANVTDFIDEEQSEDIQRVEIAAN